MISADYFTYLRLKSTLKDGATFDATDIIKNAAEELKRLLQKWPPGIFPSTLQLLVEVYSFMKGPSGGNAA